jgi:hypothetical protein
MLRSYENARPVFEMLGAGNKIGYQLFDLEHGYWPEDREAMLGWFDLHLKGVGNGAPVKETPFKTLPEEKLMVYSKGHRDPKVADIAGYCKRRGTELRSRFLAEKNFNPDLKKEELRSILRIPEKPLSNVFQYSSVNGWDRFALETSDAKRIPLLHRPPDRKSSGYVIVCNPGGKRSIPAVLIDELKDKGFGIAIVDLSGTGETSSKADDRSMHTVSRAELWLGKTVLGEWVNELSVITKFLKSRYGAQKVGIDGSKEAGLAGLFLSASEGNVDHVVLRNAPISYLFDSRVGIDYFSMAVHLPGFLAWGDVSLAAALGAENVTFINPVTMSGHTVEGNELKEYIAEFEALRKSCGRSGETVFSR